MEKKKITFLCGNVARDHREAESKSAIPMIIRLPGNRCPIVRRAVAGSGGGYRNANTSSFLLFPETKVRFSVWLTEQKRTEDVTCAFLLHVQFPGKLNLGWSWNLLGVLLGRDKEEDCVRGWPVSPDPYSLH